VNGILVFGFGLDSCQRSALTAKGRTWSTSCFKNACDALNTARCPAFGNRIKAFFGATILLKYVLTTEVLVNRSPLPWMKKIGTANLLNLVMSTAPMAS
jgi:hypothetical protein